MKPLLWLANVFINTFGITQPTPDKANRMAIFIGVLLFLVLVGVTVFAVLLRGAFHT